MLKAVIFDLDGLLIDSEPYWRQAYIDMLGGRGFTVTHDELLDMAGKRPWEVVEELQHEYGWDPSVNRELVRQIESTVQQEVEAGATAKTGALELIQLLHTKGTPMAVISSSNQPIINGALRRLQVAQFIGVTYSAQDETKGGPYSDVFLTTCSKLGMEPAACVALEDSICGIKAAKAAGLHCIAVPEAPYDEKAFNDAAPDRLIPSLEALEPAHLQP